MANWLKTAPWWVSTLIGIIAGALQILYPLLVSGEPITGNTIILAIVTAVLGALVPAGVKATATKAT